MNVQRLLHPIQARRWDAKCSAPWPTLRALAAEPGTVAVQPAPRPVAADLSVPPAALAPTTCHHCGDHVGNWQHLDRHLRFECAELGRKHWT